MDQLETQVSDLRSFLGPAPAPQGPELEVSSHDAFSPGPLVGGSRSSHQSPLSALGDNSALSHQRTLTPAKRRADDGEPDQEGDGPAKHQRSKRNRYISIACNECKRRKIKCNGQTPCQRCGHLNLQCLYAPNCCSNFKDSQEFRQMADQVKQLQDQVDSLFNSINALRQETLRLGPLQGPVLPPPSTAVASSPTSSILPPLTRPPLAFRVPPSFSGPTSIAFTVDVAKDTLRKMGYSGVADANDDACPQPDPTPHASPHLVPVAAPPSAHHSPDPIWEFDEAELLRLLRVYEVEVHVMYPVPSMGPLKEHAKQMAAWMDSVRRNGFGPHPASGRGQPIMDPETLLLKITLCCGLTVEEHGNSARAARLYDNIQPIIDKMLMSEPTDVTKLPFLALCAGYRYLSNDEVLAWRVIGHVARLCLELGLHRREGLQKITDQRTATDALHTFWSCYVLDRRWSFSTGLPFVCHDDKIDPKLPYPEGYPFLIAMIGYSKLSAKVWSLVDYFEPAVTRELKRHDFDELEREIMLWYESVPEEVKSGPLDGDKMPVPAGPSYDLQRLRIWTRLRLNQVRIWLYTPVLHSATSIAENAELAVKAVDLAKQTIRLLAHLNNHTDLYRRIQVFYHQFLTSSIAVLFLASTHAPLQFSAICRDEFYMALDLVKGLSSRSWVSHRLWRTIRSLRAYAPRLGLGEDSSQPMRRAPSSGPFFTRGSIGGSGSSSGSGSAGHSPAAGLAGPSFNHSGVSSRSASGAPVGASPSALTPGTASQMQQHQQHQQQRADDQSNGVRLQTEMSRIFEGYMGMNGGGVRGMGSPAAAGPSADMAYGGGGGGGMGFGLGLAGLDGEHAGHGDSGVYRHMKDMF